MPSRPSIEIAEKPVYPDQETCKIVAAEIAFGRSHAEARQILRQHAHARDLGDLVAYAQAAMRDMRILDERVDRRQYLHEVAEALERRSAPLAGGSASSCASLAAEAGVALRRMADEGSGDAEWLPLAEFFHFARDVAARAYGGLADDIVPDRVRVATRVNGGSAGAPVVARTTFPENDERADRSAEVTIVLSRANFDDAAYFLLPSMIHHEIFVHAVQALERRERREPFGETCPMAEGFVDAAAHATFMVALRQRTGVPMSPMMTMAIEDETQRGHLARLMAPPRSESSAAVRHAATNRLFGARIFDLVAEARGGPDAKDWAIAVAMRLNLLDLDGAERFSLMEAIDRMLGGSEKSKLRLIAFLHDVDEVARVREFLAVA